MPQVVSDRPMSLAVMGLKASTSTVYRKVLATSRMAARLHLPRESETVPLVVKAKLVFTGPPQRSDSEADGPPLLPDADPAPRYARQPVVSPAKLPRSSEV